LAALKGLTDELRSFKPCSPVGETNPEGIEGAWQRNAMLWGRPIPAMAATDLRAVVDYAVSRGDADARSLTVAANGNLAIASVFSAATDNRVVSLELDFRSKCFATGTLRLVPFVLRQGDALHWVARLADRRLVLAGVPKEAGDAAWLQQAFRAAGNAEGLKLAERR